MKNLTKFYIETKTYQEYKAAAEFLAALSGIKVHRCLEDDYYFRLGFILVGLSVDGAYITSYLAEVGNNKTVPFNQIHTILLDEDKIVEVKLNNEYTAQVSKDGIKVGCKTFSLDIAEKLLAAVKGVKKD